MIRAMEVGGGENLAGFSKQLQVQRILHRISEQNGLQIVWVSKEGDISRVRDLYAQLRDGGKVAQIDTRFSRRPSEIASPVGNVAAALTKTPVVGCLIFLSVLVTAASMLSAELEQLLFTWLRMGSPQYIMESGEYWRVLTPIFMHFSVMHIVFNLVFLWVFGHQIEFREKSLFTFILVIFFAVPSNTAQYFQTGSYFGGMSGVVYGILAYCWVWDQINPRQPYGFPKALMGFMLGWLLLGFTPLLKWVGFGSMANAAHVAGLVAGLIAGGLVAFLRARVKPA